MRGRVTDPGFQGNDSRRGSERLGTERDLKSEPWRSAGGGEALLPAIRRRRPLCRSKITREAFSERTLLHSKEKCALPAKALQFLQPGTDHRPGWQQHQLVLARQMPEMALTVITPSIRILQTLMSRLVASRGTGGDFSPTEESFFGENRLYERCGEYAVDTLFFSCQGLERDSGLCAGAEAHAALLKQMMLAARQTVALVDGGKLGRTGVARGSAARRNWTV